MSRESASWYVQIVSYFLLFVGRFTRSNVYFTKKKELWPWRNAEVVAIITKSRWIYTLVVYIICLWLTATYSSTKQLLFAIHHMELNMYNTKFQTVVVYSRSLSIHFIYSFSWWMDRYLQQQLSIVLWYSSRKFFHFWPNPHFLIIPNGMEYLEMFLISLNFESKKHHYVQSIALHSVTRRKNSTNSYYFYC